MDRTTDRGRRDVPGPRRARTALALALTTTAALSAASPAHAEPAHRYWSTWTLQGTSWQVPERSATEEIPADGSVVGLRFALLPASATNGRSPRATPSFEEMCGRTAPEAGTKRVGVVVDHGRPEESASRPQDAPQVETACAVAPVDATLVATVRHALDVQGTPPMVCAVDDHPAEGCSANRVADADPAVLEATEEPVEPVRRTAPEPTDPDTAPAATPSPEASPSPSGGEESAGEGPAPTAGEDAPAAPERREAPDGALVPWYVTALALALLAGGLWMLLRPLPAGRGSGFRHTLAEQLRTRRGTGGSAPEDAADAPGAEAEPDPVDDAPDSPDHRA